MALGCRCFVPVSTCRARDLAWRSGAVIRTYSVSSAPSDECLRISVKRVGAVSGYLHDHSKVGDGLQARAPRGGFVVDAAECRPLVLLAAGVGATPLLSMLREVVFAGKRVRRKLQALDHV